MIEFAASWIIHKFGQENYREGNANFRLMAATERDGYCIYHIKRFCAAVQTKLLYSAHLNDLRHETLRKVVVKYHRVPVSEDEPHILAVQDILNVPGSTGSPWSSSERGPLPAKVS